MTTLTKKNWSWGDIEKALFSSTPPSLDPSLAKEIKESHESFLRYLAKGNTVYGVNTGFGSSSDQGFPEENLAELQDILSRYHGIGLGESFSKTEVRGILLCRAYTLSRGRSGVSAQLIQKILGLWGKDIYVPQLGSVGASGDLTPLSYVARALRAPGGGLEEKGFAPGEALAVMNGTAALTAVAMQSWLEITDLVLWLLDLGALCLAVSQGNPLAYHPDVARSKGGNGTMIASQRLWDLLGSSSSERHPFPPPSQGKPVQDRYSLRALPQILGPVIQTLRNTGEMILQEFLGVDDNPLWFPDGRLYPTGNFYGGAVALACDYLRIALATAADTLEKQNQVLLLGHKTGLPENLAGPANKPAFGLKALGITVSSLCAEIQFLSAPVSTTSRPTENYNQDRVSMGTISARKLRDQKNLLRDLVALQMLSLSQAIHLSQPKLPKALKPLAQELTNRVPFIKEDRVLDQEARDLSEAILNKKIPHGAQNSLDVFFEYCRAKEAQ